jgi:predicted TPR repeat methyltransferase
MTKEENLRYSEPEALRDILKRVLSGRKFMLDCGCHVTFGHNLGNDITIINGKEPRVICSLCGH